MNHSGHEEAWREWRAAMASPRMHHAWLLAGMRGIGKYDFAMAAARELVAEPGVRQPADHPDILLLTHLPANPDEERKKADGKPYQTKRNISVDQIRAMQQRLTTRPTLGSRRAIVIFPADDLEKGAANALLKSLEEPPQGSFFVLVTHRPGRLLPTIRSRCRVLRLAASSNEEVARLLAKDHADLDPAKRAAAVAVAAGSPRIASDFLRMDLAPLYELMLRIVREGDAGFGLRGQLAAAIGQRPDRERQLATLDLARSVIGQEMRQASQHQLPGIIAAYCELNRLAGQAPTYNFDPALLVMEIGGLLASAAPPREAA